MFWYGRKVLSEIKLWQNRSTQRWWIDSNVVGGGQMQGLMAFYKGFLPNFARIGSWNVVMFLTLEQVSIPSVFLTFPNWNVFSLHMFKFRAEYLDERVAAVITVNGEQLLTGNWKQLGQVTGNVVMCTEGVLAVLQTKKLFTKEVEA